MSFFSKVLASVGIGGCKVDTKLAKASFVQGEQIDGVIAITGGKIDQQIEHLYIEVCCKYDVENDDNGVSTQTAVLSRQLITQNITVLEGEEKEVPFSFQLPYDTPMTYGKTKVWLQTSGDIKNAMDPNDTDFIKVEPNQLSSSILHSMEDIGFRLREVVCEEVPRRLRDKYPFAQEWEFVPASGEFRGRLDEIELIFMKQNESNVELLIEVDRRARDFGSFLSEFMETDETKLRVCLSVNDIPQMEAKLTELIRKYA
ncbi:sporulation protein [Cytobacillus sp. FSL M8-0252]|uniref:sporulation protein n=1 Tax=unclassified Cytobacillus TaxID=2675268 RepID=UPI002AFEB51A|nr:sporulation protein [Cytobacillus sp. OWB-43]MEA1852143.1 sporulation protein [Cytobacillus sp. OWB-43]